MFENAFIMKDPIYVVDEKVCSICTMNVYCPVETSSGQTICLHCAMREGMTFILPNGKTNAEFESVCELRKNDSFDTVYIDLINPYDIGEIVKTWARVGMTFNITLTDLKLVKSGLSAEEFHNLIKKSAIIDGETYFPIGCFGHNDDDVCVDVYLGNSNIERNNMISVWGRIGMTIKLTKDQFDFINEGMMSSDEFENILKKSAILDGESYFPPSRHYENEINIQF
jgi:hypothetical protein